MKKRIIMGIIGLLLLPNIVLATNFSVKISCPSEASPGEKITCNVTSGIDETINGIQGRFSYEGIVKDGVKFTKNQNLNCYSCDADGFAFGETNGIFSKTNSNSISLGSLEFNIPDTATSGSKYKINITDIMGSVMEGEGATYSNQSATISIRVKSNNNLLSSLSVGSYILEPVFNPEVLTYKVQADDVAKVNIKADSADGRATVTGAGDHSLKYGDNTINIVVKSETGETRTYKIIVNRLDNRDKVNTLNNLLLVGYDLDQAFDPNKTSYTATIPSDVDKVKIEAERTNALDSDKPKSTFVKKYGPREVKVDYGKHSFEIRVQAENEKVKKYTINITRIDDRDPNNNLKTLNISSGKFKFDKDTTNYIINVENNVGVVNITCEAESEKAEVTCPGNVNLDVGSNKVSVKVKAENETTKEYKITINRLREGTTIEEVENIVYLKHLSILNKSLKFNQKTTTYDIPITKDNSLTFEYELFDGINGTIELKDSEEGPKQLESTKSTIEISPVIPGSIILLNVESEEGYSRMYTFNVKVADYYVGDIDIPVEKEEVKWSWKLIVGLICFILLLAEIGYAIYFAVKNGGVENKKAEASAAIKGGIEDIKKIPQINEKKKEERALAAQLKAEEKAKKAEQKRLEAEERKKQKESERLQKEADKKAEKEAKELEKKLMEEKKRIAKEAAASEKAYIDSFNKPQDK